MRNSLITVAHFADNDEIPAIFGTNWFDSLQLDFNSIFRDIKFCKPLEQPDAVHEWTKIVSNYGDHDGSRPAKHLTTLR